MRFLITADIHNGYRGKLLDCVWSMEVMRRYAADQSIKTILVCGDLFHDRVSLGIDVVNAVYDQLMKNIEAEQTWYCFPGNHDMFLKNSWEVNSLRVFRGVLRVIEDVEQVLFGDRTFHILPFIHYESKYMEVLKKIETDAGEDDILLTHIGINGATLNECFLLKNWNIVNFRESKFKRVFVGHFHCNQTVGENVWYPGSPIPFRYDEGVVPHGFLVFDLKTNAVEFKLITDVAKQWPDLYETRPPEYLTIIDENIKDCLGLVPNNHIRLMLTRQYTHNELANIRLALHGKLKARSIDFLIPKKEIDELSTIQNQLGDIGTPEAAMKSWIQIDQPKDIDGALLWQCFEQVKNEADERLAMIEEAED